MTSEDFKEILARKILVLDGAMGSMIQSLGLNEVDFHFASAPSGVELKGDNECLNLSHPEIIRGIHTSYIEAGADIIETNSFGANRIAQNGFGCAELAAEMALESARIARSAADESGRSVLVAGSVGPTGKSLTLAQDIDHPEERAYDFDAMKEVFREQIDALVRGGVDFILLETCFDSLIAKAVISAIESLGAPVPLVISATVSDRSGRTLTGQTLEAFYHSVRFAPFLAAFGVNCALGAHEMEPLVRDIASFSSLPLIFFPNAGLPDEHGCYCETPDEMSGVIGRLAADGMLNIVGGCCGTTPHHIAALAESVRNCAPRTYRNGDGRLTVSGLEAYSVDRNVNFTNIGERTNVAGSRKFARLIAGGQYEEALQVAAAQIEGGANIIDINMDDAMLDSTLQMRTFLRYAASDPAVAKAAVMIDSSHFGTIVEGLKNVPGKAIVNSISLKDGEEEFVRRAGIIRSFGAAVVVMAFDEQGQATTFSRKIEICARCYDILTKRAGFHPSDIIFDVNVLSIGTGVPGHSRFGVDFIEAVRWVKQNLPGALTSGGISNLSFAFRGNNTVREAMHSAFLYHAVAAGLDMAIVNPQMLQIYDEIDPQLLQCIEDVIFDRDENATARLVDMASSMNGNEKSAQTESVLKPVDSKSADERLKYALMKGDSSTLESDVMECLSQLGSAIAVIEGPLVGGMEKVGEMFAEGKMFLPQIVRSAKIMKDAVAVLQPYINDEGGSGARPKVVIATVKGDVHDIGKNIVATVLQCSGFNVIDLGVMVPVNEIVAKAQSEKADIIAVSGLITPSLSRMEELCRALASIGSDIPLFVGGAAASAVHTAVKLAPLYGNVHYRADASATAVMAKRCISSPEEFRSLEESEQQRLRELYERGRKENAVVVPVHDETSSDYLHGNVLQDVEVSERSAAEFIPDFDWKLFNVVCGMPAVDTTYREEALALLNSPRLKVRFCVRFCMCRRDGDRICAEGISLPMLRQENGNGKSLADFFPTKAMDFSSQLGFFEVSVVDGNTANGGDLTAHAVRVALAETVSSWLGKRFAAQTPDGFKVIMPAVGYACCPDHSLKRDVLSMLPDIGIRLTDSCAMMPEASICGFVIAHRRASYNDITHISRESADKYASERKFSDSEYTLFLSHLL